MSLEKFYKSRVRIDPEVTQEDITEALGLAKKFQGATGLDFLYHVYSSVVSDIQNYMDYRKNGVPEYFKSVSGNKVIEVREASYLGVIDLWYPREICLFDFIQSPIFSGWVISNLLKRMERIEDILKFPDPPKILFESIERLLIEIKGTEFYGFWMGDARNSKRKKPIKIRRLMVEKIGLPNEKYYYSHLYPEMTLKDKVTGEEIVFNGYNLDGWSFYLSKELLADRLKDLENFWMRDYDSRVKSLDYMVKTKKKELENLIKERKEFENGITQYQKKIHDKLWKSF